MTLRQVRANWGKEIGTAESGSLMILMNYRKISWGYLPASVTKMNLLLDTHVFLWAVDDSPKLSSAAKAAILDGHNIVYVSAATAWEISIKRGLGKLKIPQNNYLEELRLHRFTPLDITSEHALAIEQLPPHHKDPFDRMLIAQALAERLTLITQDQRMSLYDVKIIGA